MKEYRKFTITVLCILVLLILGANLALGQTGSAESRAYKVEIQRASEEIRHRGLENLELSHYPSLVAVTEGQGEAFFMAGEDPYVIRDIGGRLYRFDYRVADPNGPRLFLILNGSLLLMALVVLMVLGYLGHRVVRPFDRLRDLPRELAKGNLTAPVPQQKDRYFGSFLWGLDLLRETLEQEKVKNLQLQKEKKSLVLSLAHDIKTPLSAIKLYSQALEKGLYQDRKQEIAGKIGDRVTEIQTYVGKIMEASQEDFLHLEVKDGEFYQDQVLVEVRSYYEEKLALLKIPFQVTAGPDCLLKGDRDRTVEILQNLMENAIKYGDGGAIALTVRQEGEARLFTVTNENCSLPKGELPHVFESFWRGSNAGNQSGSGLGLYICRQLAGAMGGEIFAEILDGTMAVSLVLMKA